MRSAKKRICKFNVNRVSEQSRKFAHVMFVNVSPTRTRESMRRIPMIFEALPIWKDFTELWYTSTRISNPAKLAGIDDMK